MPQEEFSLSAGLAVSDIRPEIGVPLAGFGGARRKTIAFDVFNRYPYATFLKPMKQAGTRHAARCMARTVGIKF